MKLLTGVNVITQGLDVRAHLVVERGSLAQVYDNSTGAYSPDRTKENTQFGVKISGRNPNTGQSINAEITDVDYYVRPVGGNDAHVEGDSTKTVFKDQQKKLIFKMNLPGSMSGMEVYAHIKYNDANDPTMKGLEIDTPRLRLSTSVNVVSRLSLDVVYPDSSYVGNGYVINPFVNPQNDDGTAWQRKVRCQLYDGNVAIKSAHEGTAINGNAFYFWYYVGADKSEIALTGKEEWFSCQKYSDGTFSNECTVDMAKNISVTLVCRAGYASYGELADIKNADGTISRSRLEYGYLRQQFALNVKQPQIQQLKCREIANGTLTRSQLQSGSLATTHVIRQMLIKAGGMTVNEAVNPVTKKREYTVNGAVQSFNSALGLTYSDLVARNYNITWRNATTGALLGTGEFLDLTLQQLGATSADNIPLISVEVEEVTKDLFGNNYVVGYNPDSEDPQPLANEIHGNPKFLERLEFMLFDTTTEDDSGTFVASILQRNNLFHYRGGSYAPTVGITADQKAECTSNDLYTDSACKNLAYASGKYDAVSEWEKTDKPLMAAGGKPRTLYKKDSKGTISAVSHKLRPWETTETKYSIGLGYEFPVYLLDQVKGKSGKVWKGIFTDVTEWDGIDLTPYRLDPTAWGPGAFCTVGGKARNFFYLYKGEANCQSSCGSTDSEGNAANLPSITPFLKDRTYPRYSTSQIDSMNMSRANNKNASSPYPMSEGGFFALDVVTTAVELMAHTKYLDNPELYGSGISSDDSVNADNFFKVGGVKFKKASDSAYSYATWGAAHKINVDGKSASPNWSNFASAYASKEQCMESQMAASMAAELGIKPSTSAADMHYFYMYGEKYYYMSVGSVTSLADGQMNARVYKPIDYTYTDGTDGQVTCEFLLRMSLYSGAMLSGDVFVYNGGGAELVAKAVNTTGGSFGNPVGFWMEPSQRKWQKITSVTIGETEKFGFEDSYKNIIPLDGNTVTVGNNWRRNRVPYTPFTTINSSRGRGDCLYLQNENWYNTSSANKKSRLALRFGLIASVGTCAPRSLFCHHSCDTSNRYYGGRAQALVRIAQ